MHIPITWNKPLISFCTDRHRSFPKQLSEATQQRYPILFRPFFSPSRILIVPSNYVIAFLRGRCPFFAQTRETAFKTEESQEEFCLSNQPSCERHAIGTIHCVTPTSTNIVQGSFTEKYALMTMAGQQRAEEILSRSKSTSISQAIRGTTHHFLCQQTTYLYRRSF